MAPTAPLQEKLYREIVGRIQETDTSAPTFYKGWWTYTRTVEGLDYEIYCRRRGSMDAPEEVLLDGNELAKGHEYFDLGYVERSPDENLLAYAVDFDGSERHELRFRDLSTGLDLDDVIRGVYYGSAWAADSRTFFYVIPDAAMRPYQVWRHVLGTPTDQDVLVLQEDDERFELSVEPTKSERYIVFSSTSQVTSESRFLRSDEPDCSTAARGAEAARHRVLGRPPGGPVPDPHQRRRPQLPADGRAGVEPAPGVMGRGGARARRRSHQLHRRAQEPRRAGPAIRRPAAAGGAGLRHRRHARGRAAGRRVHGLPRLQPGLRQRGDALLLHVADRALLGCRLRHAHARADAGQGAARPRWLRPRRLRHRTAVGDRAGWRPGPDLARPPARRRAQRLESRAAQRVRRVRAVERPDVRPRPPEHAGPRLRLRHRARSGWRGDGEGVVRGRQVPAQDQHVHRLHRLRRAPGRAGLTRVRAGWRFAAAAPAAC